LIETEYFLKSVKFTGACFLLPVLFFFKLHTRKNHWKRSRKRNRVKNEGLRAGGRGEERIMEIAKVSPGILTLFYAASGAPSLFFYF
jgi:hypothetical protein